MNTQASQEQQVVVDLLENYNVIVDSVAGSGKTTTCQFITQRYPQCQILLITYNSRLRLETKTKFEQQNIQNASVHTYHSFCVQYYDNNCYTDDGIENVITNNKKILPFKFDIIIIDEVQDMNPRYFRLVQKICKDNQAMKNTKICIMGDQKQCIYQFNLSDSRFIKYADVLFNSLNDFEWKRAKLSTSFRLTQELSSFLNNCVLNEDRIKSQKTLQIKPRYLICPPYDKLRDKQDLQALLNRAKEQIIQMNDEKGDQIINQNEKAKQNLLKGLINKQQKCQSLITEVFYYLCLGYKYEDIFIIAPTLKSNDSPVKLLANDLSQYQIPICMVDSSDDSKPEDSVFQKKITFLTYHQSKGLQRKVVIVLNFDESFNTFFNYDASEQQKLKCSNEHYVALTRSLEQLTIVHFQDCQPLQFLNKDSLKEYSEQMGEINIQQKERKENQERKTSPKQLTKHLPFHITQKAFSHLEIQSGDNSVNDENCIEIPKITNQIFKALDFKDGGIFQTNLHIHEMVADINETTILAFYDISYNQKCYLLDNIENYYLNENEIKKFNIDQDHKNYYDSICSKKQKMLDNPQIQDLLFLSNYWSGLKNQYIYRLNQINLYNWMTETTLQQSVNRLESILGYNCTFQQPISYVQSELLQKYKLNIQAYICCYKDNKIWEIKFIEKIQLEDHLLQFAIIKYCYLKLNKQLYLNTYYQLYQDYVQIIKKNPLDYFQERQNIYFLKKSGITSKSYRIKQIQNKIAIIDYKGKSKHISIENLIDEKQYQINQIIKQISEDTYFQFQFINIYDNKKYFETSNLEQLEKMMKVLVEYKYGNKQMYDDDDTFINSMKEHANILQVS